MNVEILGAPTDNVVVTYGRVTGSPIPLTIRDLTSPVQGRPGVSSPLSIRGVNPRGQFPGSIPLPRRDPGLGPDDAGRVDPVALLEIHHGRLGRRAVETCADQRVPATAQLLLEALQITRRVPLDELTARPRGCGGRPDAAGLVRRRRIGRRIRGRRRRGTGVPGRRRPVLPRHDAQADRRIDEGARVLRPIRQSPETTPCPPMGTERNERQVRRPAQLLHGAVLRWHQSI